MSVPPTDVPPLPPKMRPVDSDEEKQFEESVGKFIISEINTKVNKLNAGVNLRHFVLSCNFVNKIQNHLTAYDEELLKNGITPTAKTQEQELGRVLIEEMTKPITPKPTEKEN